MLSPRILLWVVFRAPMAAIELIFFSFQSHFRFDSKSGFSRFRNRFLFWIGFFVLLLVLGLCMFWFVMFQFVLEGWSVVVPLLFGGSSIVGVGLVVCVCLVLLVVWVCFVCWVAGCLVLWVSNDDLFLCLFCCLIRDWVVLDFAQFAVVACY